MLRMAKAVTEGMFEEAKLLGDEEARSLRSHALKSQSASRLAAMVTLGKLHVRNVNRGDFDRDPWLFNCANGTIDLRAGNLRPHDRNDLMSKMAPVIYDAAADCPLRVRDVAASPTPDILRRRLPVVHRAVLGFLRHVP